MSTLSATLHDPAIISATLVHFSQEPVAAHLPCARYCSRCLDYMDEQSNKYPCPYGVYILAGDKQVNQIVC